MNNLMSTPDTKKSKMKQRRKIEKQNVYNNPNLMEIEQSSKK